MVCDSKKLRFVKKQQATRLLSNLGLKVPLSKIPLLDDTWIFCFKGITFLLVENKFTPEIHLGQLGFSYSACGPFIKNKERIQEFKETETEESRDI